MFVTTDSSIRVEIVYTTCQDKLLGEIVIEQFKAEKREENGPWVHLITTANPYILAHKMEMSIGEFVRSASLDLDINGIEDNWPRVRRVNVQKA
jgi:hypothetical protein